MDLSTNYILVIGLFVLISILGYARKRQVSDAEPIWSILDLAAIPSLRQALPNLHLEVSRARRLAHSLSVIVIRGEFNANDRPAPKFNVKPLGEIDQLDIQARQLDLQEFSDCSRAFRDLLREVDCVAFDSVMDQFIIVLPGSKRIQAIETMNRINKHLGPRIANQLVMGVSEYPEDGLFLEDLIERSVAQIGGSGDSEDVEIEIRA